MSAITVLLHEIIGHHASVFPASCELAILDGEPRRVFTQTIIDDVFAELRGQIEHLG